MDLSQAKIGKLCTEANAFVISDGLGEQEFEVAENEISLTTDNAVGEWGVFIPDAAAGVVAVSPEPQNKANYTKQFLRNLLLETEVLLGTQLSQLQKVKQKLARKRRRLAPLLNLRRHSKLRVVM